MYAVKANKSYKVTDLNKGDYLAQGYDIVDDDGKVLERSPKSSVTYAEYAKAKAQLEEQVKANKELSAQLEEQVKANKELSAQLENAGETNGVDLSTMTIAEVLAKYAVVKGVNIGQATSEKGILDKIMEAEDKPSE